MSGAPTFPTELSLTTARAHFFEVTAEERKVHLEHKRMLRAAIDNAIHLGHRHVLYTTPLSLPGAYADYDPNEMTLWLLKQARMGGFHAELCSTDPPCIKISGWYDETWLTDGRPPESDKIGIVKQRAQVKSVTGKGRGRGKKQDRMTPEQASALAQTGEFSRILRQRLEKSRRNVK